MATADKLTTVAENVPKVYHAGQLNVVENAECLKGSKSDTAILLDDISPVSHEMGVKVRGKNLFDVNTTPTFTYTKATYVVEGTKVTFKSNNIANNSFFYSIPTTVGKTYTVSVNSIDWDSTSYGIYLSSAKVSDSTNYGIIDKTHLTKTFIAVSDTLWIYGYLSYEAGDFTFTFDKLQIELGTTATDYTPYVPDLTAVKVSRCGKNLFNQYAQIQKFGPYKGVNISHIARQIKGTISVSLKADGTFQQGMAFGYLSVPKNGAPATGKWFQNSNDTKFVSNSCTLGALSYSSDRNFIIGIYPSTEENWNNIISNYDIQIEIGSTATDYEPYITPTDYTPTADGTVDGVTSLYPNTTLTTDTDGVIIDCDYYKDIDKAFNELTTSVALSGGE